jgi:septal ring factor EnvC (AmiA/AmiB activator)
MLDEERERRERIEHELDAHKRQLDDERTERDVRERELNDMRQQLHDMHASFVEFERLHKATASPVAAQRPSKEQLLEHIKK